MKKCHERALGEVDGNARVKGFYGIEAKILG